MYTLEQQTSIMPSKTLTNYFRKRSLAGAMPVNPKKNHIQTGDAVSFRAPDAEFCEMFNLALDASGMDRTGLCVEAITAGLPSVVASRLDQIQRAGSEFLRQRPNDYRKGRK